MRKSWIWLAVAIAALIAGGATSTPAQELVQTGPRLDFPAGIALDDSNVYVANSRNETLVKIPIATQTISLLAGQLFKAGVADGTGPAALFASPDGLALVGTALYVTDTENSTIRKVDVVSGAVKTVAGTANISGVENGRGPDAHFNLPTLLATDGHGTLFIADTGNSMIRKMTLADMVVTTIGGQAQTEGKDDGPASKSTFGRPRGIATDGKYLYVGDTSNQLIRKIDLSTNTTSTIAGKAGVEGKDDGPGAQATFDNPGALATDGTNLYVADADNHAIRKIKIADNTVTTLCLISGHIGSGLAINKSGSKLYLADTTENAVVQVDTTNGTVSPFFPK